MASPSVQAFKQAYPEFQDTPDEEIESLLKEEDTPPPPDALPGSNPRGKEPNPSTGYPAIDAALGMGQHFANTALNIGEIFRSSNNPGLPGIFPSGKDFRQIGDDIASKVFGLDQPTPEAGTLAQGSEDARAAMADLNPVPGNTAAEMGAGSGALIETLLPLLATGGGSGAASLLTRGRGFLPAAGEALKMGGKEAALSGATTIAQEGEVGPDAALSAAISGVIPMAGRAVTGTKAGVSRHLADTLVPTGSEATLAGGDAARGLQESGVVASGSKSLMMKVQKYASKTASDLDSFVTRHPSGSKPLIDRYKMVDSVREEIKRYTASGGATGDSFGGARAGEKKAIVTNLKRLVNTLISYKGGTKFISPREALQLRREIGEMTSFGKEAEKTTASVALNETRQSLYSMINEEIDAIMPEAGKLSNKAYDAMLALEGVKKLVDSPGLGRESFLVRRALPLGLSMAGGAGTGFVASGGNPLAALAGLGAGAAMGMPGAATPLIQALRTKEGTRAAEIAARIFGLTPQLGDEEEEEEQ